MTTPSTNIRRRAVLGLALAVASHGSCALAQSPAWPGKGLAQHDFLYAGQHTTRDVYMVRGGKVVWEFHDHQAKGEISDMQLASNGNLVLAHQYGVKVINQDKTTLWAYEVEPGHEIHTAQFIGTERVIFVQSGPRPRIMVANIKSGTIERSLPISAGNLDKTHGQLRQARLTPAGTYLLAQMDLKRVVEIDEHGKEVWQLPMPGIWSAQRLSNGNLLLTGRFGVLEHNPKGETVWALTPDDVKQYGYTGFQVSHRLPNGNTLINHWVNAWNYPNKIIDVSAVPPQLLEVTPDKKVVWALHQWSNPNLGPSTSLQLLNPPSRPEEARFGSIR